MKRYIVILIMVILVIIQAETLFQVKDSGGSVVLDISNDGMTVLNQKDTLMTVTSSQIKAFIDQNADKALSRSFSVTSTSSGKGANEVFSITNDATQMFEGSGGSQYTDFSPENIFIGLNSGMNTTPGVPNALSGINNIFLGNVSGLANTSGCNNIMIGDSAGVSNTSGYYNVFMGNTAGFSNNIGNRNVFIGFEAGYSNEWSDYNTFVGSFAGKFSTGNENTFVGCASGNMNSDGHDNSSFGFWSGSQNTTGDFNSLFGSGAGLTNNGGSGNTMMGYLSGSGIMSSNNSYNSFFGFQSGYSINTGSNNVMIGSESGYNNTSGNGNVFLGYRAGYNETASNKLYVANSNTSTPLIKGTFPNTDLTVTAETVSVMHPLGSTSGLYIQNTYSGNTDNWHFYQYSSDELSLYYNATQRGSWNVTTGAYTAISDRKLKKNIEDIGIVKDKLMQLQPKRYNFISQKESGEKYIGLIAQDVEELFPEFVNYIEESDTYSLDYAGLSVVAIQAIKEQQTEIDDLKKRLIDLEQKFSAMK